MEETAQVQINTDDIDDLKADTKTVEQAIMTLNHEMGIVKGRLGELVWLFRGVLAILLVQWITALVA